MEATMAVKNPFGKTVEQSTPHATYRSPDGSWEWLVLKTYQRPDMEDQHSRWFLAVMSPFLYGSHELGDGYARDIRNQGILIPEESTPEWVEAYGGDTMKLGPFNLLTGEVQV
jgi:hypothetical protein